MTEDEAWELKEAELRKKDQRAAAQVGEGATLAGAGLTASQAPETVAHPSDDGYAAAHPKGLDACHSDTPRTIYSPEAWATAEWAIPLHTHPAGAKTWDVPKCPGDYKAPTPDRVRGYIAQAVFRFQQSTEREAAALRTKLRQMEAQYVREIDPLLEEDGETPKHLNAALAANARWQKEWDGRIAAESERDRIVETHKGLMQRVESERDDLQRLFDAATKQCNETALERNDLNDKLGTLQRKYDKLIDDKDCIHLFQKIAELEGRLNAPLQSGKEQVVRDNFATELYRQLTKAKESKRLNQVVIDGLFILVEDTEQRALAAEKDTERIIDIANDFQCLSYGEWVEKYHSTKPTTLRAAIDAAEAADGGKNDN